eukprot:447527-Hanusia_phi.AAC.1
MASDNQGMKTIQSKGFTEIARSMRSHQDTPSVLEAGCKFCCQPFSTDSITKLMKIKMHQVIIDSMKQQNNLKEKDKSTMEG